MNQKIKSSTKNLLQKSRILHAYYSLQRSYKVRYRQLLLNFFPVHYAQYRYKQIYGRFANLKNPVTFDEKLLWLLLFWRHPLKSELGDKYSMRAYVEKKGFGHVLPGLLGVYNHSSEIDFNSLPEKFVLKCTHGCGFNIVCFDKTKLDFDDARQKLNRWMKIDYSKVAGELHYAGIKPRIICEEFLESESGKRPNDYKVYCMHGKAHCILLAQDRNDQGHTDKFDIYNLSWTQQLPYYKTSLIAGRTSPPPVALDEMIKIAESLSKPFPFVRVDFYSIRGKAYLGELTFTPSGCINSDYTDLAQATIGSLIQLPEKIV